MIREWVQLSLLPWLVYWLYRIWTSSWRVELIEPPELKNRLKEEQPVIFAHWHGDELSIVHLVRHYKIATMTSTSKDGTLMDKVITKLGGATSRGSSTRGGIGALKGLIRLLQKGRNASMAVDGPKGPLHQVKPGVFELSRLAKAMIFPVGVASKNYYEFERSWNKARLPLPFTRVIVYFGPGQLMNSQTDIKDPQLRTLLGSQISDACHQAAKLIAE